MDNSVLLAADREEIDPSYAKRDVDKIYRISATPFEIYMAGSGPSAPIAKANMEIDRAIQKAIANGEDLVSGHQRVIESTLRVVHKQFKSTLDGWPMHLAIVVKLRIPEAPPILYRTDGDALIVEQERVLLGTGMPIADHFAKSLYEYPCLDKANLLAVAAFIFREAHSSASGVGEHVDMRYLYANSFAVQNLGPDSIRQLQAGIPSLKITIWDHWKEHAELPDWAKD
jgi:20S proteasome alpha/beta subunit